MSCQVHIFRTRFFASLGAVLLAASLPAANALAWAQRSSSGQSSQSDDDDNNGRRRGHSGRGSSGHGARAHEPGRSHSANAGHHSARSHEPRRGRRPSATSRGRSSVRSHQPSRSARRARVRHGHGRYGERHGSYVRVRRHRHYVSAYAYPGYALWAEPPRAEAHVYRGFWNDRFDLGLGLGAVGATVGEGGLPMLTGKLRLLGQVTPRLGLGLDFDASSMLFVNHLTANVVMSYDLLAGTPVTLRPYLSMGGGGLHIYDGRTQYLAPVVAARGGIELKPVRWMGLSLEAGALVAPDGGPARVLPFAGGTLSLYVL